MLGFAKEEAIIVYKSHQYASANCNTLSEWFVITFAPKNVYGQIFSDNKKYCLYYPLSCIFSLSYASCDFWA